MRADVQAAAGFDLSPWVRHESGPGVIAAVLADGAVASWVGRGQVALGAAGATLTPETVFNVASVSKQFTGACVTSCEADGVIEVDGSIRRHLPELPALFEPITIRHLLHHLGGLPHGGAGGLTAGDERAGDWRDGLGLWDLVGLLAEIPALLTEPGARYAYSNCGYWLLAAAVERASGGTFADYARRQLFEPLGMAASRFRDAPDAPQPGLAPGHLRQGLTYKPVVTRFHGVGDGGLLTSVRDLARWDVFWAGRAGLAADLPSRMLEQGRRNDGARLAYARGVSVRRHRGVPTISHGGSFLGYQSKFVRFPDQDFSICALANSDDVDVDGLCIALADKALGDLAEPGQRSWAETFRDDGLAA